MLIHELVNNPEFGFNVPFRIRQYIGDDDTITAFDSTISGDIPFDLMSKHVTAINTGEDGVLEIEYSELAQWRF